MPAPRILLVEDELPIRRFVRALLSGEDYQVEEALDGKQAIRSATQQPPDLIILDLGLPDCDGLEVLRQLREWSQAPVIILSARDRENQKVAALDAGADDYLTKPFGAGELLARVRVALRHSARVGDEPESSIFECGDLKVDLGARRVTVRGADVKLTPLEYKLLTVLVQHPGKVLTHSSLLKEVWGPHQTRETHYLRVFMASLRRKIELDPAQPRYLLTEQGVGYRLAAE